MTIDEYQNNVQLLHKSLVEFSNHLEKLYIPKLNAFQTALSVFADSIGHIQEPYTEFFKEITASSEAYGNFVRSYSSAGTELLQQLASKLSAMDYSVLAESISDIKIYDDFVLVPESFIPNDFCYEEFTKTEFPKPVSEQCTEKSHAKRLPLPDALTVISIIVTILISLLAPFYNRAVENFLSEKGETKVDTPMTEEQAQQMLSYLSELTAYQQSIITAIEASEESLPKCDLNSADAQHHFATPDSANIAYDESCPAFADESKDFEQR